MTDMQKINVGEEIKAMGKIAEALEPLSAEGKKRVLIWAAEVSGLTGAEVLHTATPHTKVGQQPDQSRTEQTRVSLQSKNKTKAKSKSGSQKESYSLVKDMDFGMPGQKDSLFDYIDRYKPSSSIQNNVVFVKYLSEQQDREINANLIYSCYSTCRAKLPKALYSSLTDTAKAGKGYGYIDTSDINNIKMVHKGEVLLHELLKKAPKAA